MEKVKVLHIVSSLWSGGVAVLLKNYYENIDKNKVSFDFLVSIPEKGMTEKFFEDQNCTIYHLKGMKKHISNFFKTYKIVKKNKYKIVHVHHNDISFLQLFAAWLGGAKIRIAHSHDELFLKGIRRLRKIYCFFTRIFSNYHFACSTNAGRYLFGKAVNKDNFLIIHNGIDYNKFLFSQLFRDKIRKLHDLDNNFVIGNVGRLCSQKNQMLLLNSFRIIVENIPNSKLVLIGKGEDYNSIINKIKEFNIENNVIMIDVTPDVNEYLSAFDVFVFPSVHEGLGIAFLEAQASGLPCVISDRIPKEAIVSEDVNVLSLNDSPELWANEIIKTYNHKRDNSGLIGLEKNYNIFKEAKKLEEWYIEHNEKSI